MIDFIDLNYNVTLWFARLESVPQPLNRGVRWALSKWQGWQGGEGGLLKANQGVIMKRDNRWGQANFCS